MAYRTSPNQRKRIKEEVLALVAGTHCVKSVGNAKYRINNAVVHVRFCATGLARPSHYKFNINPNTLSADYELWICGSRQIYYLIPIAAIKQLYSHRSAYVDGHHPKIRAVSIDVHNHLVKYASPGLSMDLKKYLQGTLESI